MKIIRVSLSDSVSSRDALRLFDDAGKELHGKLLRRRVAKIPDLDSSPIQFHIHASATRHLGTVTTSLRKLPSRHGIAERVTIERLD